VERPKNEGQVMPIKDEYHKSVWTKFRHCLWAAYFTICLL